MSNTTKTFDLVITKKGYPAMWEDGGGLSNSGHVQLICGSGGERLNAITTGHKCLQCHALFIVRPGILVINVSRWRTEIEANIYKLIDINTTTKKATGKLIYSYELCQWDIEPPFGIDAAVIAAVEKSRNYHCREAVWAIPPIPRY